MTVYGLFGAFLSMFLTALKFSSTYSCDVSLLSSCRIGKAFNCESVLSSPLSTFPGGIPISVAATSFYIVVIGLAMSILIRPRTFAPACRVILLAIAWAGFLVIIPLSIYALTLGLCSYCLVIYLLNIALLLAASLMNPKGSRASLAALFNRKTYRRTSSLVFTSLTFIAVTMLQILVYLDSRSDTSAELQCVAEAGQPPETSLIFPEASGPTSVDINLFVDLSCSVCRSEFATWKEDVLASNGKYRLKIYHFPREGECVPMGDQTRNFNSQANHSCAGARAVECIERLHKGLGLPLLEKLFELQDLDDAYFSVPNLSEVVNELVHERGHHVDQANPKDPFFVCVEDNEMALNRVLSHARFASYLKLTETPGALFVFYDNGEPNRLSYLVKGSKQFPNLDEYIESARTQVIQSEEEEAE